MATKKNASGYPNVVKNKTRKVGKQVEKRPKMSSSFKSDTN